MDEAHCKPVDLMITSIPVPPCCIRPTVAMSHGLKSEDDLTAQMSDIIWRNQEIRRLIDQGVDSSKLNNEWFHLQCSVAQYFNSETPGLPKEMAVSKKIRALNQRLKGKQGRFR